MKSAALVLRLVIFLMIVCLYTLTLDNTQPDIQQQVAELPHVRGRCGPEFPLANGEASVCNASTGTCCSRDGWCSFDPEDCICHECIYYEWEEVAQGLEDYHDMYDDNSEIALRGYMHYVIEPRINCENTSILLVVMTAINNFNARQLVRTTWGNKKYMEQINAQLLFVVGQFPNREVQTMLEKEAAIFGDILQAEFLEDYYLLAYKSLAWMHWSREKCQIPWLVKTDDDMVNNIWAVGKIVDEVRSVDDTNSITCQTKRDKVYRSGKYAVPKSEERRKRFPINCWGPLYVMHNLVRDKLLQVYEHGNGNIMRIDDIFITGLLAEHTDVEHRDFGHMLSNLEGWSMEDLLRGPMRFGHVGSYLGVDGFKKRYYLWRRILEHEFPEHEAEMLQIEPVYAVSSLNYSDSSEEISP